jgi:aminomuconate-semialdehyde/2-hydroxymuconate-6-semialdehyde dehydrogenase
VKKLLNFIGGRFVEPVGGGFFESFNPAEGKAHLLVSDSDSRDVDQAVAAASAAFPLWSAVNPEERARLLYHLADLVDERKFELAEAESSDQGKPVWLAETMDITRVAQNFRFFAGCLLHQQDHTSRMDSGTFNYTSRKPVGVAGLISPWNLPLYLLTWKIAPAIAFGNTVVCKPSELTSLTAFMLCEILIAAGIPTGVVNMVFGTGPRAGAPLVAHPDVPLISFTGGTATGRAIAQIAAPMFKKMSLELGGKNPNIIFDDANLDEAIESTIRSSFLNQGEICLCGSRIYVHESIYAKFLERFVEKVKALKVGDPREKSTFLGALVSREHLAKVESFFAIAASENARILTGGKRAVLGGRLSGGYFLEPTVIVDVKHNSRIQQDEIFGPVVSVTSFKTDDEVVGLANGVSYGLSATIWTTSLGRAHTISERLDAGTVWVNTWLARDLRVPFGGVKASGLGREGQDGSLEFFTEAKNICIKHS